MPAPEEEDPRLAAARLALGLRLRELRQDRGLSLPEASARTRVSLSYLSDCERGRKLPSLPILLAVADGYDLLVTDLLAGVYPFGSTRRARRLAPPPDGRRRPG